MDANQPWYEDDHFWESVTEIMFGPERWEMARNEIDSIVTTLDLSPGLSVLDLCCGPGRHSIDLARRGYMVTGVDRTTYYLDIARDKAAWESLKVEFVQEDMRRFCRPDSFDLALNMYTTFGYFDDLEDEKTVAANVYKSLKPGGRWVLDLIGKEVLARIFQARDWVQKDDGFFLEERLPNADWSFMKMRWIYLTKGARNEYILNLRMFSAAELSSLIKSVGFSQVDVYGDLNGAPYDHKAKRLIVIARK